MRHAELGGALVGDGLGAGAVEVPRRHRATDLGEGTADFTPDARGSPGDDDRSSRPAQSLAVARHARSRRSLPLSGRATIRQPTSTGTGTRVGRVELVAAGHPDEPDDRHRDGEHRQRPRHRGAADHVGAHRLGDEQPERDRRVQQLRAAPEERDAEEEPAEMRVAQAVDGQRAEVAGDLEHHRPAEHCRGDDHHTDHAGAEGGLDEVEEAAPGRQREDGADQQHPEAHEHERGNPASERLAHDDDRGGPAEAAHDRGADAEDVEEQEEQRRRDEHALDQAGHCAKGEFTDRREMDVSLVLIRRLCANEGRFTLGGRDPKWVSAGFRHLLSAQDRE